MTYVWCSSLWWSRSPTLRPFQNPVYAQVQLLFKDAPDLLEEFKDFLPEALSTQFPPAALVGVISQQSGPWNLPSDAQPPEKPTKSVNRRKKRAAEKEVPTKAAPARVRCEAVPNLGLN